MGFRFKKVSFTGGASNFPVGTTQENLRTKSESIVKGVAQALIDLNIGWGLDSTRSTSITDFTEVPVVTDTRTYPGLFLVNSVSGNKLFVCYIASTNDSYGIYTDSNYSQLYGLVESSGSHTTPSHTGLIMSMIPGDANESFGSLFGSSFLPQSATRLIGTCAFTNNNTWHHNIAYMATSGITYMYGVWATEYCVMISTCTSSSVDTWIHIISYAVGRILGTLAHESDTLPQSRYGVIQFSFTNPSTADSLYTEMRRWIGRQNTQLLATSTTKDKRFLGLTTHIKFTHNTDVDPTYNVQDNEARGATCQIFSTSGSVINNTSTTTVTFMPLNYCVFANTVSSTANSCRWSPYLVYVYSEDISANGVVSGDGVKGLLDIDLFRCSNTNGYTSQTDITLYNNGKFIQYMVNAILGWDSNNESLT